MANNDENTDQAKAERKRSANWDNLEKSLLKWCMKEFVSIIENKNIDTNTNKNKTVAWQAVTKRFNELNNRLRDVAEIKQQWRTMKLDAKKNMSKVKTLMKSTGGGPKPPSATPETIEILSMIPQEFETDLNFYDSDGIATKKENSQPGTSTEKIVLAPMVYNIESQPGTSTEHFVLTPMVNNIESVKENIPKLIEPRATFKSSGIKRKYKPTHQDESVKERNNVLINCITEEHDLKIKHMIEAQGFIMEEHNLKKQQMLETHSLLKEESQLRLEKFKLDILLLKSNGNL